MSCATRNWNVIVEALRSRGRLFPSRLCSSERLACGAENVEHGFAKCALTWLERGSRVLDDEPPLFCWFAHIFVLRLLLTISNGIPLTRLSTTRFKMTCKRRVVVLQASLLCALKMAHVPFHLYHNCSALTARVVRWVGGLVAAGRERCVDIGARTAVLPACHLQQSCLSILTGKMFCPADGFRAVELSKDPWSSNVRMT